ncbi:MAG: penicillin acylase family protein [Leptospiraceae bacterium]|nr:penicillin acylase family protein [Leptospiraceae bacterium]
MNSSLNKFIGAIFTFIIVIFIVFYSWMKSTVPKYSGKIKIPAIQKEVEIQTDMFGVPHIFASNKEDLFFTLGYVQARERMFQLQLMKRLVSGRVAEFVGRKGLSIDKYYRTIGFRRNSEKWFERNKSKIPPEILKLVESYHAGINYFGETAPVPVDMVLLGMKMEKITIPDSLAFISYMGSSFSEAFHSDPVITSLVDEYGDMVEDLTGKVPNIALNSDKTASRKFAEKFGSTMRENVAKLIDLGIPLFKGSNSWVVSPKKSKSGKAMLSNDPHIAYSNPSIWFEAYLEAGDFSIYGHFLPLIPFPVIGFKDEYAWGLTMFENDDIDFYKEELVGENKYLYKGKEEFLEVTEEEIKIKGEPSEKIIIKSTIHGPLMNSALETLDSIRYPVSMKWNVFDDDNLHILTLFGFTNGKNLAEFKEAAQYLKAPGLNIVYADKEGNIAYFACGGLQEKNFKTDRILDGASGKYEWGRKFPFEAQPQRINPPEGYIFTANHKHFKNLSYNLPGYWQADDRTTRLKEIFESTEKWGEEEMKNTVLDSEFQSASWLIPFLLESVEGREKEFNEYEEKALTILKNWDRRGELDSIGASVYSEFRVQLAKEIFLDEMGKERYLSLAGTSRIHHFLKAVVNNKNSKWWNNKNTPKKETYKETTFNAYRTTINVLMGKLGFDIDGWQWRKLHTLELKHPLGRVGLLRPIFNSGPRSGFGGSETINNLLARLSRKTHEVEAGPSMRTQIDFAHQDKIRIINPLGQSGHRLSPHFQDQADMFIKGEFRTLDFHKMRIENSNRIIKLIPKN